MSRKQKKFSIWYTELFPKYFNNGQSAAKTSLFMKY